MIRLINVEINKYKSFDSPQSVAIDDKITPLVGMNESGKTAFLEAIAKTNYFTTDPKFKFNVTHDYPRKEKKKYEKSGNNDIVVTSKYKISDDLLSEIEADIGKGTFTVKEFEYSKKYDNKGSYAGITTNTTNFFKHLLKSYSFADNELKSKILNVKDINELEGLLSVETDPLVKDFLSDIKKYTTDEWKWNDPLSEYVARVWIAPNLPKYLYYDEYYALPSRINLRDLQSKNLDDESLKTSRALFELADINMEDLMNSEDFESFRSELEATSNEITQTLFQYWRTNKELRIRFEIDKQVKNGETYPILDIRVENLKHMVTLPLKNRSKGFNWFFSFIVWFSKIQENKQSNFIILLDEPGLNLHATAQADLLNFIEHLSEEYQVIYTTHSPFMIEPSHLERVRTVLETDNGSVISESIQEKDPDTLFPLQAALGYNIAQNLFISKNNLLVEGASDLLYLTVISNILENEKRDGLKSDITIVPVGGLDKVATFISLLRGNKLNIACLLDSFTDVKGKQRVQDLIAHKIVKDRNIRFFHEFSPIQGGEADIEDIFTKEEYLKLFNEAFPEYKGITEKQLDVSINKIIPQICKVIGKDRFNHYRPANKLAQLGVDKNYFSEGTLTRFENMFKEINKLF